MCVISRESKEERKDGRGRFIKLWMVQLDGAKVDRWENWKKSRKYRPRDTMVKKTQFLPLSITSIRESQCSMVGPLMRKAQVLWKHIGEGI